MRLFPLPMLALLGLAACVTSPQPPQVASSPVAYAYPTARSGASPVAPVQATPVVATPGAASAAPAAGAPKTPRIVAEPVVVVAPAYRLPSDAPLSR